MTDPGRVRPTNQDQFLIAELAKSMLVHQTSLDTPDSTRLAGHKSGYLFLVADGLSGEPAGERASSLAVDQVIRSVLGTMPWFFRLEEKGGDLEEELRNLFEKCQRKIESDARENPSRSGMGTTLTMAYVLWPILYVIHVGGARAYLLRGNRLRQVTRDHTVPDPSRPPGSRPEPAASLLWNVIGGKTSEIWPDVHQLTLETGDALLLATDGLPGEISESAISKVLASAGSAEEAARALVRAANEAGGRDNVTVIVVRFGEHAGADGEPKVAREALAEPVPSPLPTEP